jgi:hypothetical protein
MAGDSQSWGFAVEGVLIAIAGQESKALQHLGFSSGLGRTLLIGPTDYKLWITPLVIGPFVDAVAGDDEDGS